MSKKHILILIALFPTWLLLTHCTDVVNNWPQFRGPDFNMVLKSNELPSEWGDSLNIRWEHPVNGDSWSSPIIYGDKVFYTSALLVKKAPLEFPESDSTAVLNGRDSSRIEQENQLKDTYKLQLVCLDLKTGNELWKVTAYEGFPKIVKHVASSYACETPVTDGKHIYAYYGMHGVYCYDMQGNLVWDKDLGVYKTLNDWGTGSSPVLYNNLLYIQVDNEENSFIVALDALSGEEKWRKDREEKTTYTTPVIWQNNERAELVTLGTSARSYDPNTGDLLWEVQNVNGSSIPSPVFDKQNIYFGKPGGFGRSGSLFAVKAGAKGNITPSKDKTTSEGVAWSDTLAGTGNPTPVLNNGLIYLLSSRGGELCCVNASDGKLIYKQKVEKVGACWASPWICNDRLYFYDEKGNTKVIKTGQQFELLGSYSIDDKFWASIAATNDAYIFKGAKNIYCVGK